MPPPPHGVGLLSSPRNTAPTTTVPRGVSRYTGPPESPKHESLPLPPATNSPPGLMPGTQPTPAPLQSLSVIGAVASLRRVLLPCPAVSVRPKPTSWIDVPFANVSNVHDVPTLRGVTPVIGWFSTI